MDTAALDAFAATSNERQQEFEQCLARAGQLTVSRDAFGHQRATGNANQARE